MGVHTEKGRVVYNRKKHEFTNKDLERIGKKIGAAREKISLRGITLKEFVGELFTWISENPFVVVLESVFTAKGDTFTVQARFGSRDDEPDSDSIIIIVEKD
jgi:hypothetical protein